MYEIWNRLQYMLSPQFDIYEQLSTQVHGKVADIGCGTGFGTHILTRKAKLVDGYEVDANALYFAKRVFSNGNLQFWKMDITELGNANMHYDCITMVDVIEHIEDDDQAVVNIERLLKSDGVFFCSTPNKDSRYRKSENHVREYSQNELFGLMINHFKTVDILDFKLEKSASRYDNPIVVRCRK